MKRSEMIVKLAHHLMEEQGATSFKKLAESMLDFVEGEGMRPPVRVEIEKLVEPYEQVNVNGVMAPMMGKIVEINEWEAEDVAQADECCGCKGC